MPNKKHEQLLAFAGKRIPLLISLLLIFLFFMPLNSVQFNYFRPSVGIICVYYWRLNRPLIFGYFSAFIIGLMLDVYGSTPLGLNALLLLLLVAITTMPSQYLRTSSFSVRWLIFGFICMAIMLLKWLLLMLYFWHFLSLTEIMLGYFSTVMFYPLIATLNMWIAQKFLPPENIDEL